MHPHSPAYSLLHIRTANNQHPTLPPRGSWLTSAYVQVSCRVTHSHRTVCCTHLASRLILPGRMSCLLLRYENHWAEGRGIKDAQPFAEPAVTKETASRPSPSPSPLSDLYLIANLWRGSIQFPQLIPRMPPTQTEPRNPSTKASHKCRKPAGLLPRRRCPVVGGNALTQVHVSPSTSSPAVDLLLSGLPGHHLRPVESALSCFIRFVSDCFHGMTPGIFCLSCPSRL